MRTRSSGLGRTELVQEFTIVERRQDCLLIEMRTTSPVKWHVRTIVTYRDLLQLIRIAFKPSVLWWIVTGFRRADNPRPIEQY